VAYHGIKSTGVKRGLIFHDKTALHFVGGSVDGAGVRCIPGEQAR
jgi:hypothetical protein